MADLAQRTTDDYQPNEGFVIELNDIDETPLYCDDGSRMTITVVGADSDIAVKATNDNQDETFAKGFRAKLSSKGVKAKSDTYLAKCTIDWHIQLGGQMPAFQRADALKLYANPKASFIRDQVEGAIAERTNFLKKSSESSSATAEQ